MFSFCGYYHLGKYYIILKVLCNLQCFLLIKVGLKLEKKICIISKAVISMHFIINEDLGL